MKNIRRATSCNTCRHSIHVRVGEDRGILGCNEDRSARGSTRTVKYDDLTWEEGYDEKWARKRLVLSWQVCDAHEEHP